MTREVVAVDVIVTVNHVCPPVIGRYGLVIPFMDVQFSVLHEVTLVTPMTLTPTNTQWRVRRITSLVTATYHLL